MGPTRVNMLRQVQLPMAKRTIVVGINQCMMAALSMAHHRQPGQRARPRQAGARPWKAPNVGAASVAGLAIVVMAIMLDRTTTAASERSTGRSDVGPASGMSVMLTGVGVLERLPRWATEDAGPAATAAAATSSGRWLLQDLAPTRSPTCVFLSRQQLRSPTSPTSRDPCAEVGQRSGADQADQRRTERHDRRDRHRHDLAQGPRHAVGDRPVAGPDGAAPWWVMALVLLSVAYVLGGGRPTLITAACEGVILWTGLWNDSMVTLSMTLDRHRPGDADCGHPRRRDGPEQTCRSGHSVRSWTPSR